MSNQVFRTESKSVADQLVEERAKFDALEKRIAMADGRRASTDDEVDAGKARDAMIERDAKRFKPGHPGGRADEAKIPTPAQTALALAAKGHGEHGMSPRARMVAEQKARFVAPPRKR